MCGYVKYNQGIQLSFKDCVKSTAHRVCAKDQFSSIRRKTCRANICISKKSRQKRTWQNADKACGSQLSKLTDNSVKSLEKLLLGKQENYWIGLRRQREWRWIDGSLDSTIKPNTNRHDCLVWFRNESYWYSIVECTSYYYTACEHYKVTTTTTTTQTSTTSTTTTSPTPRTASSSTTWNISEMTSTSDSTMTPKVTKSRRTNTFQPNDNSSADDSVEIGVSIGIIAVIVLIAVVAVVWIKRRKALCFKDKKLLGSGVRIKSDTTSPRISNQNDNPIYCVASSPLSEYEFEEACKTEKAAKVKNESAGHVIYEIENDVNYEVLQTDEIAAASEPKDEIYEMANDDGIPQDRRADDKGSTDRITEGRYKGLSTIPQRTISASSGSVYDHLEDDLKSDNRIHDAPGDHKTSTANKDIYNHIDSKGSGGDTYDTADTVATSNIVGDEYSHVGKTFDVPAGHMTSAASADVYNHIDSKGSGADTYDSTDSIVTSHFSDDDYNHIEKAPDDTYYNVGDVKDVGDDVEDREGESEYANYRFPHK
ncbi:uncharacterized protein LOC121385364 [Gigantopelta aegis]|uniref:uncharacterized protein LOC121385364 n=1 Tax=Gigantopelta aegis TaxID=1735272 RepID=UPI001B88D8A3|nr:uncharacterized protein LOC121385364 [Gigantopelta aegis]XP_041371957.1 uncharacterized protein LOC121385364 [Gigantopelta aegis]